MASNAARMAELSALGRVVVQARLDEGRAFAKRWREGRRDALLGGQIAAAPAFPYPGHRSCAEW